MEQPTIQSLVLAACVMALTGCASTTPSPSGTPATAPDASHRVDFPDMDKAWLKGGTFIDVEQLRRIGSGMTKNQVRELISYPHFNEGLFGPREWNYIFNFRTGRGNEFITCQYMVHFDKDVRAQDFHWKGPSCESVLAPVDPIGTVPVAVVPLPTGPKKVVLGADGLFRFDGAALDDLLPEGRRKVERLAAEVHADPKKVAAIRVTGHTDRLGSVDYNQALSVARARTVRELLVQQGVAPGVVRAGGMGKSQPVVECRGRQATPALVGCLQPNRRVEIEVTTAP